MAVLTFFPNGRYATLIQPFPQRNRTKKISKVVHSIIFFLGNRSFPYLDLDFSLHVEIGQIFFCLDHLIIVPIFFIVFATAAAAAVLVVGRAAAAAAAAAPVAPRG